MNKKKNDKLVLASYSKNALNRKAVNKITTLLSKSDLKKYINAIKLTEKKKNIVVSSPIDNPDLSKFEKLFPNKKILFKKDLSLLLGVRIVDNDIIYEFTLKNSLDKIVNYIEQNYD